MPEKSEPHPIFQLKNPWEKNSHHVWLASTLTLTRNLQKYLFPSKLDKAREELIVSLVFESLRKCTGFEESTLYLSEHLGSLHKEFLLEHFLIQDSLHKAHAGEGFVIDAAEQNLAILNISDHLQLQLIDTQQELEKLWNQLIKVESHLSRTLDFAFDPRFGFLTSNSRYAGTGLVVHLYLHIPAINHTGSLGELLEREGEEEVETLGLQGKTAELAGDILIARNLCTIGLTEEYILTTMRMWATRAVVAELSMRKKLIETGDEQLKNKVTRALGVLTHSYQLEVIEALNALSLVKLGIEIGWITAPTHLNMNKIFFNCRRAHLMNLLQEKVEISDLPRKRAEYLHKVANELTLSIS